MDKQEAIYNLNKLKELIEEDPRVLNKGLKGDLFDKYRSVLCMEEELLMQVREHILSTPDLNI